MASAGLVCSTPWVCLAGVFGRRLAADLLPRLAWLAFSGPSGLFSLFWFALLALLGLFGSLGLLAWQMWWRCFGRFFD